MESVLEEKIAREETEKKLQRIEYINKLNLCNKTQEELKQLLFIHEDNIYGRRIFGMEQDPENEKIIDAIKTVISRNGGIDYVYHDIHGYVR